MPSESDGTKQPDKSAEPDGQSQSNSEAKDSSKLQSQSSTGSKPFMIYPIPKAGAPGETDRAPQGMTYDQVLAKNSPVNAPDQKTSQANSTATTPINFADAENSKSNETRTERVSRTLIDFEVPQTDKFDSQGAQPTVQDTGHHAVSHVQQNSVPLSVPLIDQHSMANDVSHATPAVTPHVDNESSSAVLSRIAGSQAINHERDSTAMRPPEVPPPMKRKRSAPKTMLDILVRVGNQLTGAGHAPEVQPELLTDQQSISAPQGQLQGQPNSEDADSSSTEYYSNEAHYPATDYSESNEPQTFYQGVDGQLAVPEETRGERTSRTLLDHSILADLGSKSAEKMILKAAEELKEKKNEPFIPFIPVMEDRMSSPCPWRWDGNEGDERVKYCEKCQHQVYNFAGIERPEANALIFKRENAEAKTLFKRADGKFMTSDCPVAVKQTRSMVLVVVIGLFFMIIVFAAMLLAPQQPKQEAVKQEVSPYDQSTSSLTHEGRGSSSSHGRSNPTTAGGPNHTTPNSKGGSASSPSATTPQSTSSQTGASNGGYGPMNAPTSSASDFQWNYPSGADNNRAPVSASPVTPSSPSVDPAQAAELQRLKQQIIDSGSK